MLLHHTYDSSASSMLLRDTWYLVYNINGRMLLRSTRSMLMRCIIAARAPSCSALAYSSLQHLVRYATAVARARGETRQPGLLRAAVTRFCHWLSLVCHVRSSRFHYLNLQKGFVNRSFYAHPRRRPWTSGGDIRRTRRVRVAHTFCLAGDLCASSVPPPPNAELAGKRLPADLWRRAKKYIYTAS